MAENGNQTPPLPVVPPVPSVSPTPLPTVPSPWAKVALWLGLGLLFLGAGVYVFKSCVELPGRTVDKTGEVIEKAALALAELAAAFTRGTITTSFVSYATTVTNQHYLQFATLKQVEVFTRTEATRTGFGYIPLPEVVVEARAPVEYTYYLDLMATWRFVLEDRVVHAFVPPIGFNKPAVDASAITYEVRKGVLKTAVAQENLKKSITSLVESRARENIPLVREAGRKEAAHFVERFLAQSFPETKGHLTVKVHFPDEPPPDGPGLIEGPRP